MREKKITITKTHNIFLLLLLLSTLFMGVGYASMNSILLDFSGDVAAKSQEGVFISEVGCYQSEDNQLCSTDNIISSYQTTLNSNITLENDINSTMTYQVTFYNNSDMSYYYDEVTYLLGEDTYSNENIIFEIYDENNSALLADKTEIPSKGTLNVNVRFKFKSKADVSKNSLVSLLNFKFVQKFNISYLNIDNSSNLAKSVYSDEKLTLTLNDVNTLGIKEADEIIESDRYTFSSSKLTMNSVSGDLIIYDKVFGYTYTGDIQEFTVPIDGTFKIELWGARGGTLSDYSGGKGGYTCGDIFLEKDLTLYLYLGGRGKQEEAAYNAGGYNGGGYSGYNPGSENYNAGGGGATDLRLVNGKWNNFDSLKSRIMVAAGGGGSTYSEKGHYTGGPGGGLIG